jgi:hypothetical protein
VANLPPVSRYRPWCHRHQYQWHQRQQMGSISVCWDLKVNLKPKIYL